jgi:cell division protein FtsB
MAIKKKTKEEKPLTIAQKRKFLEQIAAAEKSLKSLDASVKTLRAEAVAASYVNAMPAPARRTRRKRG